MHFNKNLNVLGGIYQPVMIGSLGHSRDKVGGFCWPLQGEKPATLQSVCNHSHNKDLPGPKISTVLCYSNILDASQFAEDLLLGGILTRSKGIPLLEIELAVT